MSEIHIFTVEVETESPEEYDDSVIRLMEVGTILDETRKS